jgi:hypothetical protein
MKKPAQRQKDGKDEEEPKLKENNRICVREP